MAKYGADLSEWNGKITASKVVKALDFAILRVGYGVSYMPNDQKDGMFDTYYSQLHGKIPLGIYYYAYATNREQGKKEADNCLAYLGDKKIELPIFYDVEEKQNTRAAVEGFIARMREKGRVVGIYCSTSYYDSKLSGISTDWLWLAEWGSNNGKVPSHEPSHPYDIWQYTSNGSVNGISGRVDMNKARDSIIPKPGTDVKPTPAPAPTPAPTGSTLDLAVKVMKGEFGNGDDRKKALGSRYDEVQDFIDHIYSASVDTLAQETINGKYGNGDDRETVLGPRYDEVQNKVNSILGAGSTKLKVGDKVRFVGERTYSGLVMASWTYNYIFTVMEVSGDRVVIGKDGAVTAAVNIKDCVKV